MKRKPSEEMWIATAEECRELDRRARDEFGIPVSDLMQQAGQAVFAAVQQRTKPGSELTILCGKGNNGGDGFFVARIAKDQGYAVECLVAAHESELGEEARKQCALAIEHGVHPVFCDALEWSQRLNRLSGWIVDALLGTGARGAVGGPVREAIVAINQSGLPVIAVDIPSGIECDTGAELGASVQAAHTVTFGLPKPFLFLGAGVERSGTWEVAKIGFPDALLQAPRSALALAVDWVGSRLPKRKKNSHKGANGSVLVVAGSHQMTGAASLAALAAYRSGAGLVTVAAIDEVCQAVATHLPEAIFMPLPELNGSISPDAASILLKSMNRFDSAIFGPGLSASDEVCSFLNEVWKEWRRPSVIDADALNAVSQGVKLPHSPCVLTPHPGELARLLATSNEQIQANRFKVANQAAEKFGRTVVLKGAYSLTATPDEPLLVNTTGNSGMAAAGMGDVLCGVIATLLAQGLLTRDAAACGVYWHGLAGDSCKDMIAPIGYLAHEVADALPKARATITSTCVCQQS